MDAFWKVQRPGIADGVCMLVWRNLVDKCYSSQRDLQMRITSTNDQSNPRLSQ